MTSQTCTMNRSHLFSEGEKHFFFPFSSPSPLTPCVLYSNERSEVRTLFSSRPWMLNSSSRNCSMTPVCCEPTEKRKQMLVWGLSQALFANLYLWSTLGPLTKSGWTVISDLAPFSNGLASSASSLELPLVSGSRGSPLILPRCLLPFMCKLHKPEQSLAHINGSAPIWK